MSKSLARTTISLGLFMLLSGLFSPSVYAEDPTFAAVCSKCHTSGMRNWLSGAPNLDKPQQWQQYLQRDSVGEMRKIVMTGYGKHKVKGGCKSCSEADIHQAIDYMLSLLK